MKSLFLVIAAVGIMAGAAWGETVTGVVDVQDLIKIQSKWKFQMANTSERFDKKYKRSTRVKAGDKTAQANPFEKKVRVKSGGVEVGETHNVREKGVAWGAFVWCISSDKLPKVRYAYTYGERTEDQAWRKAAYAFDSMEGRCNEKGIKKQLLSSDDL
jgi:hypothetical protein